MKFVRSTVAAAVVAAMICGTSFAQDAAKPKADGAKKAAGAKKEAGAKKKSRLPTHFAKVVDPEQRAKLLEVRDTFADKKAALQEQLDAIEAEEMAALEALLTPEQKQKLATLRAEAKAAKDKKAADKKAADGKAPAKDAKKAA